MRVIVAGGARNKWNHQLQEIKETEGTLDNRPLSFFISHDLSI